MTLRTEATDAFAPASAPASGRRRSRAGEGAGSRLLVLVFIVTLCLPIIFFIGPLRLAPYRLLLIVVFLPLAAMWASGRFGGVKSVDLWVAAYCVLGSVALVANHGLGEMWQTCGIFVAEAFGSYLLARALIRTPEDFTAFVRSFALTLAVLIPFVAVEALTGYRLLTEVFKGAFATYTSAHEELRWGMTRAQGTFEHPILFGVFASAAFSLAFYSLGVKRMTSGLVGTVVAGAATFFSLSLGAYLSIMFQCVLIAYDKFVTFVPRRWWVAIFGATGLYVLIDLLSNRGPVIIFLNIFTFNPIASWQRIAVFEHASAAAWRNPLFGIGLEEFERPKWVTWSIDNFWLLNAVRYGLPAFLALFMAFWLVFTRLGRLRLEDAEAAAHRKGLLLSLGGLVMAICTVHVWNATFAMLMFLLGSGVWLIDRASPASPPSGARRGAEAPDGDGEAPLSREPSPAAARRPEAGGEPRTWI